MRLILSHSLLMSERCLRRVLPSSPKDREVSAQRPLFPPKDRL